jgi:DNA-directed RNA polymerase subunit omega
LIHPTDDPIEDTVRSRYSRVVIAAKRAKQIKEGAPVLIDTESTNPLTIAMEEIAAGKVTILESSIMPTTPPETHAQSDAPSRNPRFVESQAGPLLFNGLSGDVGPEADEEPGASALDMDDPEAERLAEEADEDTSDELTA